MISLYVFLQKINLYSDDPENPPLPGSFWATKDFRNCNIENFIKAAEFLAEKNIYVIRIGIHKPDQILQSEKNTVIIDYTGTIRKILDDPEFADAYIPANCEFFIGCTSGIHHFASIFNKPLASTNLIPYGECGRNFEDIFIFKKCINININEILSISEAINFGITGDWLSKEQILDLESRGIFFQENSPDEILDLTREMYERLNNLWNEKNDEKELHGKFFKISNIYDSEGQKFPGRVCYNFLKKNKNFVKYSINLDDAEFINLINLSLGLYSPLKGFNTKKETENIILHKKINNKDQWTFLYY